MKIYDISQEIFHASIYPGDPIPKKRQVLSLEKGDGCNLTQIELGSHTGKCALVSMEGALRAADFAFVLSHKIRRLLIRGDAALLHSAAEFLAGIPIDLIGVEGLSIGGAQVHRTLLEKEIVLLEGLVLKDVPDGEYFLAAQPLKMEGLDGSPIRPVLLTL